MDRPSAQVIRLDSVRHQSPPTEASQSRQPPAHLNAAAGRAWQEIVSARRSKEADELSIEAAAVLLARFRETGLEPSLAARLYSMLEELGISPDVPPRIPPEQAVATLSRQLRAEVVPGTLSS